MQHTEILMCDRNAIRERSLRMLQIGAEEFKIFLWKISFPNTKCYFGFIPQQEMGEKLIPKQQRQTFNYGSL